MQTNRQQKPACGEETLCGDYSHEGSVFTDQRHNERQRELAKRMAGHLARKNEGAITSFAVLRSMMTVICVAALSIGTLLLIGGISAIRRAMGSGFTRMTMVRATAHQNMGGKHRNGQDSPRDGHTIPHGH